MITLTARDSSGQTETIDIAIQVFRDRPVLPVSLSAAPISLGFEAREGCSQAEPRELSIRNDGDGTMAWTAFSDTDWIQINSTEGVAPANLEVTVEPSGLAVGRYTGSIIVTASGAANSPQEIAVTLTVRERPTFYLPLVTSREGGLTP
jgi:hypothetical protein